MVVVSGIIVVVAVVGINAVAREVTLVHFRIKHVMCLGILFTFK